MPKVSFNPKALGVTTNNSCSDMRHAIARSAPKPIVIPGISVQTLIEGLSLSDIESLKCSGDGLTGDVDT